MATAVKKTCEHSSAYVLKLTHVNGTRVEVCSCPACGERFARACASEQQQQPAQQQSEAWSWWMAGGEW